MSSEDPADNAKILKFLKEFQGTFAEFDEKYSKFTKKFKSFFDPAAEKAKESAKSPTEKIKLNVGGKMFASTRETLTTEEDTFFCRMLNEQKPDQDGVYFIDRDNSLFHLILNHLRGYDITKFLKNMTDGEKDLFKGEVEFYGVKSLSELMKPSETLPQAK